MQFLPVLLLVGLDEFQVCDELHPKFVALGVALECGLVLFKLGELDVLSPILIVEGEGF